MTSTVVGRTRHGAPRRALRTVCAALNVALAAALVTLTWLNASTERVDGLTMGTPDRPGLTLPALDRHIHPGCTTPERFEKTGAIPATAVVVTGTGDIAHMPFDVAWERSANANAADDVWTIGLCA